MFTVTLYCVLRIEHHLLSHCAISHKSKQKKVENLKESLLSTKKKNHMEKGSELKFVLSQLSEM